MVSVMPPGGGWVGSSVAATPVYQLQHYQQHQHLPVLGFHQQQQQQQQMLLQQQQQQLQQQTGYPGYSGFSMQASVNFGFAPLPPSLNPSNLRWNRATAASSSSNNNSSSRIIQSASRGKAMPVTAAASTTSSTSDRPLVAVPASKVSRPKSVVVTTSKRPLAVAVAAPTPAPKRKRLEQEVEVKRTVFCSTSDVGF